jgi:MFS family permease
LWFLVVAVVCSFFLWQVVVTQGPLHLQDRGFDPAMAAFFYSLAIGLSVVGRFTAAALGDTIEPRFLFAFGALCILLGGILFWFVSPTAMWAAYLYPLLGGFGFGIAYICVPTIVGNYWGARSFASINGVVSPISMLFQGMAAPLAGFLYDLQDSYLTILIVGWAVAAVGLAAIFLCRPPKSMTELSTRGS